MNTSCRKVSTPIRDRIKELRRVSAASLRPNPRNWRLHPAAQRAALSGILSEIGYADALLARELPDGTLELIDGHLRAETTPNEIVPVLVLDVDEAEANKLLATLDPLAAMAESSSQQLAALLCDVDTQSAAVNVLLDNLRKQAGLPQAAAELASDQTGALHEAYHVLIECTDENEQRTLLERFTGEGLTCRALFI